MYLQYRNRYSGLNISKWIVGARFFIMEEGCYSKASKEGILKPCGTGLKSDTSI